MSYQDTPTGAAIGCPHRVRHRDECATCGARKRGFRWRYLDSAWQDYYSNGGPRPAPTDEPAPWEDA